MKCPKCGKETHTETDRRYCYAGMILTWYCEHDKKEFQTVEINGFVYTQPMRNQ